MSIVVKGMEMPKNCKHCPFMMSTICNITNKSDLNKRQNNCPLVELPEKHGRLIDENILSSFGYIYGSIKSLIDTIPTIFEAEE